MGTGGAGTGGACAAACCSDDDCTGNFACSGTACSTTVCRSGYKRCGAACIASAACCAGPRDCSSSLDNDCDGKPDNTIDGVCQCAPGGPARACNMHPGKDGVGPCRAGTQTCVLGNPPTSSGYGGCTGDVGPAAPDDCAADGADLDCDGIKGNGAGCTKNVYVYVSNIGSLACGTASANWPIDIVLADEEDPAGAPNGFTLVTQFKVFRGPGGTKRVIYRCQSVGSAYHYTAYGSVCPASDIDKRMLGYVSSLDGGNGWVALAEFFGQSFGPTGAMRADDSHCCSGNCGSSGNNFVLK